MWLIAEYEAVSLFSLKMSSATASGGKTLLVPTPYAVKMALLDAACRIAGVVQAETLWPTIRDLSVAILPAERAVVTNLFQRVLRPRRVVKNLGEPDAGPFQRTIGYREYVQLQGSFCLGLGCARNRLPEWLGDLVLNVNYLGKRGSLMQIRALPTYVDELLPDFVELTAEPTSFDVRGTLQVLDDCTSALTFAKANIYDTGSKIRLGKERITRNVVLPYRLARSTRSYSMYERVAPVSDPGGLV